jgi:hypothetical protein
MRLDAPAWLLACALLSACGGDDSTTTAPPPKVSLRISALIPVGEAAWYAPPAGEELLEPVVAIGCDRTLGVALEIENFSLRAPNACGGAVQCGYDQVSLLSPVDGSIVLGPVQSASNVPLLNLGGLEPLAGAFLVRPELLTTVGTIYTRNYLELPADLPVTFTDVCDPSAGGAGGAGGGDSEANAGASGLGGATGE